MIRWKQCFVLFLTLCVSNLYLTGTAISQQNWYAKAEITKNKPVIRTLPEEKIPVETTAAKEGGGSKTVWVILGVALVGGVAALMGGGDDSGDDDDSDGSTSGNVTVYW